MKIVDMTVLLCFLSQQHVSALRSHQQANIQNTYKEMYKISLAKMGSHFSQLSTFHILHVAFVMN
jgi:hypothetical protein